jgi:hypothetical protein
MALSWKKYRKGRYKYVRAYRACPRPAVRYRKISINEPLMVECLCMLAASRHDAIFLASFDAHETHLVPLREWYKPLPYTAGGATLLFPSPSSSGSPISPWENMGFAVHSGTMVPRCCESLMFEKRLLHSCYIWGDLVTEKRREKTHKAREEALS